MLKETLSASKIKTLKACSWQYWCKYHLKLPDKTNSGALKGDTVHIILECLGSHRHKAHYDKIIKNKKTFSSKAIKRLIYKHIKRKKLNEEEDLDDICEMVLKGLFYDFFGNQHGEPTEVISEKDFELVVQQDDINYKIKGFIDKLFIYENAGLVLIRDFKTNKKKYEGKEISDNLQDYMYTLAIRKLYPHIKNIKMEFIFLKQDLEDGAVMEMQPKSKFELIGFEHELTGYQKYADTFSKSTAVSNMAANQGMPKDGSFSGKLLCGFAKQPNQIKKDGTPMWYCTYKFPFRYFALYDKNKALIKTAFDKKDLVKIQKPDQKIIAENYAGCPCWQEAPPPEPVAKKKDVDHFDLDSF
jgi:hypothetical protein